MKFYILDIQIKKFLLKLKTISVLKIYNIFSFRFLNNCNLRKKNIYYESTNTYKLHSPNTAHTHVFATVTVPAISVNIFIAFSTKRIHIGGLLIEGVYCRQATQSYHFIGNVPQLESTQELWNVQE